MNERTSAQIQIALFDVAGTLTTSNTWGKLIDHPSLDQGQRRRLIRWAYPAWLATKVGLYSELRFRDSWIRGMAKLLANRTHAEVHEIYNWLVQDHTLPNLHEDVIQHVRDHKAQGHMVIFVSNMFEEAVQLLAEELGADKGLGTKLEFKNNQATGKIASEPCAGTQKLKVVRDYLADQQQSALDLQQVAVAYSDSWSDRYMLGGVAQAVATYPDKRLRQHAQNNGWQTLPNGKFNAKHRLDA